MLFSTVCLLTLINSIQLIQPAQSLENSTTAPQPTRIIKKRSFSPWSAKPNTISLYQAGNAFKPAPYSLSRPYYIPVYGVPGNFLFYPPQPLYVNPGTPQDNPYKRPFEGPSYLPPTPPKETTIQETEMRFGLGEDSEEDPPPVWGDGDMVQMPLSAGQEKESSVIPTRRPAASATSRPPLVHDQTASQNKETSEGSRNIQRPQSTTQRPSSQGPSNCVWAIISCCSTTNPNLLSQNCFEQRGCPGPFWGDSPCNSDFARAAIAAAVNYYNSGVAAFPQK